METMPRFDTENYAQDFEQPVRHGSVGLVSKSIRRDDRHSEPRRSSYPAQISKLTRYPPLNKPHFSPASISLTNRRRTARHKTVLSGASIAPTGLTRYSTPQIPTNVHTISERLWDQVGPAPKRRRLTTEYGNNAPRATPQANDTQAIASSKMSVEPEFRDIVASQLDVVAEALRTGNLVDPEEVEGLRAENRILRQRLEVCRIVLEDRLPKPGMDLTYRSAEVTDSGPWNIGNQNSQSRLETTKRFGSRARTQSSSPEYRPNNPITLHATNEPHLTRSRAKKQTQLPSQFEYQDCSNESTLVGDSIQPSSQASATSASNTGRKRWYNLSDCVEYQGLPDSGVAEFSDEEEISPQSLPEGQSRRQSFVEDIIPSNQNDADESFENNDTVENRDKMSHANVDEEASSDILQHDEGPSMFQLQTKNLINNDDTQVRDEVGPPAEVDMLDPIAVIEAQAHTEVPGTQEAEAAKPRSSAPTRKAIKKASQTKRSRKPTAPARIPKSSTNEEKEAITVPSSRPPPEADPKLSDAENDNIDPRLLAISSSLAPLNNTAQEFAESSSRVRQRSTRRSTFRLSTSKPKTSSTSRVSSTPATASTTDTNEAKRFFSNSEDESLSSHLTAYEATPTSRVLRNRSNRTAPLATTTSSSDSTKPPLASTSASEVSTHPPKSDVNHTSNPISIADSTVTLCPEADPLPESQTQFNPGTPAADNAEEPAEKASEVNKDDDEEAKRRQIVEQLECDLNSNPASGPPSVSEDPRPENMENETTQGLQPEQNEAIAPSTYSLRPRQTLGRWQKMKPGNSRGKRTAEKQGGQQRDKEKEMEREKDKEREREKEREKLVNAAKELQGIDEPDPGRELDPELPVIVDDQAQALEGERGVVTAV